MSFAENLRQAWNAIVLNKKRSVLTIIGIVVGLSAVITIVSLGNTITGVFREYISSMLGSNTIVAVLEPDFEHYFTDEEKEEFLDEAPDAVYDILVQTSAYDAQVYSPNSPDDLNGIKILGVSGGFQMTSVLPVTCGRFINRQDCDGKKNVIMISDIMAENIFGSSENAVGKQLTVKGKVQVVNDSFPVYCEYTVVGVYKLIQGRDELLRSDDIKSENIMALIPYTSYYDELQLTETSEMDIMLQVVPRDSSSMDAARKYTEEYMAKRALRDPDNETYIVTTFTELLDQLSTLFNFVLIVFILIAAISLLVGGIGLMNTMLVTVTERTKEIGIRKALGAKNSAIRRQFLTESAVICLLACAVGIFMSAFIGVLIEANIDKIIELIPNDAIKYTMSNMRISFTPSLGAVIVSSGFSIAVGLIFGFYPANKGAKMQPVDALRYE